MLCFRSILPSCLIFHIFFDFVLPQMQISTLQVCWFGIYASRLISTTKHFPWFLPGDAHYFFIFCQQKLYIYFIYSFWRLCGKG